jgi:hypothetical protein
LRIKYCPIFELNIKLENYFQTLEENGITCPIWLHFPKFIFDGNFKTPCVLKLIMFLGDKSKIYCWNAIPMATCNYFINQMVVSPPSLSNDEF